MVKVNINIYTDYLVIYCSAAISSVEYSSCLLRKRGKEEKTIRLMPLYND